MAVIMAFGQQHRVKIIDHGRKAQLKPSDFAEASEAAALRAATVCAGCRARRPRAPGPGRRPTKCHPTALAFSSPEAISHTSSAVLMASNVSVMRIGGGFGLSRTAETVRVSSSLGGRGTTTRRDRPRPCRAAPRRNGASRCGPGGAAARSSAYRAAAASGSSPSGPSLGGHRVHPRRVERHPVEQRRAGLRLVAVRVAGRAGTARRPTRSRRATSRPRHAPVKRPQRPIDLAGDPAAGQHDRRLSPARPARRSGHARAGPRPRGEHVGVGVR